MGGTTLSLDERIEQLVQFEAEHGHMYVPQSEKGGLGIWVMNARAKWKQGKFKRDETSKLDEIGFVWNVPKGPEKDKQIVWGKQFRLLVKYYKTKGDCDVPSKIAGEENPLFTWCQEQRRLHAKGEMGQDNIEKMTKLGFDFYGPSENREEGPPFKRQRKEFDDLLKKNKALEKEVMDLKEKIMVLENELGRE